MDRLNYKIVDTCIGWAKELKCMLTFYVLRRLVMIDETKNGCIWRLGLC